MDPLTMNDNELKQYIDSIFLKYDRERNGTLNTYEMASYLTELFQLLGYQNVNVTTEQAQQAVTMIDKNNDNKITKMELFLAFKELAGSTVTDFGDVKIFMLGQGGVDPNKQKLPFGGNQNYPNPGNQAGYGQNSNNYPYSNNGGSNNQNSQGGWNQAGLANFNINAINKPTINTSGGWNNKGNSNGWNNTGNNGQGYPNANRAQLPPNPNPNFKGSQVAQWGPQVPQQYLQSPTWGQQQGRGSGAGIQQQQQFYQQARGSGAQVQNQAWNMQARGSGVGIGGQYYGVGVQPVTQNVPLSNNLVWGNGNNQQLVWGVPGQRPGTPPSAAYSGYHQVPVYYDPYYGGYMKVGKQNSQDDKKESVATQV